MARVRPPGLVIGTKAKVPGSLKDVVLINGLYQGLLYCALKSET